MPPVEPCNNGFRGFRYPDANFVYCPNQFLEVCIAHCSRGEIRLVSYFVRQTLGWLDGNGKPKNEIIRVKYNELIKHAGVSRGVIRSELDNAIAHQFVKCVIPPSKKKNATPAISGGFELQWSQHTNYRSNLDSFDGFYAGEGHRTPVPNDFFDHVIPNEPLAVIKVVGAVIRHTVGYQTQFGGRRSTAPLSYSYLQKVTGIKSRTTLSNAIKTAIQNNYIVCCSAGTFSPHSDEQATATYGVFWQAEAKRKKIGSKIVPACQRFKNRTSIGSKTGPEDRFKNRTNIKETKKEIPKQQHAAANFNTFTALVDLGFDEFSAQQLTNLRSSEEIENQIKWLKFRNADKNALGLLRKAIEENWDRPKTTSGKLIQRCSTVRHANNTTSKPQANDAERQQRVSQRKMLLAEWGSLSRQQWQECHRIAINATRSNREKLMLQRHTDLSNPPSATLAVMRQRFAAVNPA